MKTARLLIACAAVALLPSCVTDPVTGQKSVSPAVMAAGERLAISALNASEKAMLDRINRQMGVKPDKAK